LGLLSFVDRDLAAPRLMGSIQRSRGKPANARRLAVKGLCEPDGGLPPGPTAFCFTEVGELRRWGAVRVRKGC
jgi:hypothetical protein